MRLDHLLSMRKEYYKCYVYSKYVHASSFRRKLGKQDEVLRRVQLKSILTCSSFFPYSVKVTEQFFEIIKEGTESILIKQNTFLKATLNTASAKRRKLE